GARTVRPARTLHASTDPARFVSRSRQRVGLDEYNRGGFGAGDCTARGHPRASGRAGARRPGARRWTNREQRHRDVAQRAAIAAGGRRADPHAGPSHAARVRAGHVWPRWGDARARGREGGPLRRGWRAASGWIGGAVRRCGADGARSEPANVHGRYSGGIRTELRRSHRRGTGEPQGEAQMVYGTYQRVQPSAWYSQAFGKVDVFLEGSFLSTDRGL